MRILTALGTLLLSAVPAAASIGTAWMTPFDLLADGSIVVPVTIGGTGPYRFVIDTGTSRSVISSRLSQALRLAVVAKTLMVTPAGRDVAYIVRLEDLVVGARPVAGVSAAVMAADRYAAGQQVDGLIGQDVLASAVYTIDYQQRAVFWHGVDDVPAGVRLPLRVRDNRLLVSLAQRDGDQEPLSLIPDSGSDGLVLFAHAQDKLRMTLLDVGVLSSVSGSRLARRVQLEGLRVGSVRLSNPLAVVVESSEPLEMMGDGLLPLHVFSSVTFNVAEGYLIVRTQGRTAAIAAR
jgi:predicted aspartyl protease